jgi:hypothetical protein
MPAANRKQHKGAGDRERESGAACELRPLPPTTHGRPQAGFPTPIEAVSPRRAEPPEHREVANVERPQLQSAHKR